MLQTTSKLSTFLQTFFFISKFYYWLSSWSIEHWRSTIVMISLWCWYWWHNTNMIYISEMLNISLIICWLINLVNSHFKLKMLVYSLIFHFHFYKLHTMKYFIWTVHCASIDSKLFSHVFALPYNVMLTFNIVQYGIRSKYGILFNFYTQH